MLDALIAGEVYGQSTEQTSRTGTPFAVAKVRMPMANGASAFVNVVAFSDTAKAALLGLDEGDSVAMTDTLSPTTQQRRTA
jgi:hypothetical protein